MANANVELLLMVFIGIAAFAVLLQAGVLLGIFLAVRKAVQTAKEEADEYRSKLTPVIQSSSELIRISKDLVSSMQVLVEDLRPQIEAAAGELAAMTRELHAQANELEASVDEVREKARHQVDRVDAMTTSALNGLDRFGSFLHQAATLPVRQLNGVVAATKAVVEALRTPAPPRSSRVSTSMGETEGDKRDLYAKAEPL